MSRANLELAPPKLSAKAALVRPQLSAKFDLQPAQPCLSRERSG
jgi:hypothetical protein